MRKSHTNKNNNNIDRVKQDNLSFASGEEMDHLHIIDTRDEIVSSLSTVFDGKLKDKEVKCLYELLKGKKKDLSIDDAKTYLSECYSICEAQSIQNPFAYMSKMIRSDNLSGSKPNMTKLNPYKNFTERNNDYSDLIKKYYEP